MLSNRFYSVVLENLNNLSSIRVRLGGSLNLGGTTLVAPNALNPNGTQNLSGVTLIQQALPISINVPIFASGSTANSASTNLSVGNYVTILTTPNIQRSITMVAGVAIVSRAGIYRLKANIKLSGPNNSTFFRIQRAVAATPTVFVTLREESAAISSGTISSYDFLIMVAAGDRFRMQIGNSNSNNVVINGSAAPAVSPTRMELIMLGTP